jgi:hypothetical protein
VAAFCFITAEQFGEGVAKDPSSLQRVEAAAAGLLKSMLRVMYKDRRVYVFCQQYPAHRHDENVK